MEDIGIPIASPFAANEDFHCFPISEQNVVNCRTVYHSPATLLQDCVKVRDKRGAIGEAGVFKGRSCIQMSAADPQARIIGFDSFQGLPQDWRLSDNETFPKGTFSLDGTPDVPTNVELVVGEFKEAVPNWSKNNKDSLSFIHIDCNLYESTMDFLVSIDQSISDKCIILFDEIMDNSRFDRYNFWREHEWKALNDWGRETGRLVRVLARTDLWHVAFQARCSDAAVESA